MLASARYRSRFRTELRENAELAQASGDEPMSTFDEIFEAALSLPPEERAMVADRLLQSLDGPDQERIDGLWAEEAERRMREIEQVKVEAIDGELVMERLRARRKLKLSTAVRDE